MGQYLKSYPFDFLYIMEWEVIVLILFYCNRKGRKLLKKTEFFVRIFKARFPRHTKLSWKYIN